MENKARAKKWEKPLTIELATPTRDTVGTLQVKNGATKSSNITSSNITSSKEINEDDKIVINNNPENPYDIYSYSKTLPDTDRKYVTDDFIYYSSKFWHKWWNTEMVDDIRTWLKQLQSIHWHTADEMRSIIFQWYTYWIWQPEKKRPKDCKASLSKNPFMKNKYGK